MEDGVCRSGNLLKGAIIERLFYAYAISAFLSYYAVPCAAFFFFYGSVALKMRRRQNNSKFESNKLVTILSHTLTHGITNTTLFQTIIVNSSGCSVRVEGEGSRET